MLFDPDLENIATLLSPLEILKPYRRKRHEETTDASAALFAGKDEVVLAIYTRLLEALRTIGPFQEDPKKTSIHLVHTIGFAGVHPRKSYLNRSHFQGGNEHVIRCQLKKRTIPDAIRFKQPDIPIW